MFWTSGPKLATKMYFFHLGAYKICPLGGKTRLLNSGTTRLLNSGPNLRKTIAKRYGKLMFWSGVATLSLHAHAMRLCLKLLHSGSGACGIVLVPVL